MSFKHANKRPTVIYYLLDIYLKANKVTVSYLFFADEYLCFCITDIYIVRTHQHRLFCSFSCGYVLSRRVFAQEFRQEVRRLSQKTARR